MVFRGSEGELLTGDSDLALFRVKGVPDEHGVQVTIKSKVMQEFFARRARGEPIEVPQWKLRIFNIPEGELPDVGDVLFNAPGRPLLDEHRANLTFLRAVDLGAGVTIFDKVPPSEGYCATLRAAITRGLREVYRQYVKPYDVTVRLWTREE